VTLTEVVPKCQ